MLNWFDIVVAIVLILAFFNGLQKGLVMQLVSLVGLILAVIFAGQLAKNILPWLMEVVQLSSNVAPVVAYIVAFALIMVVISLIGNLIQKFMEAVHINFLNKLLGGVIALGISMVILSLILNLVLMLDTKERIIKQETKENSFFYNRVQMVVPVIVPYLNSDIWEEYVPKKYRNQIEQENPEIEENQPDSTGISTINL